MYVKGVGPARSGMLETKGLRTVEDLLAYPPFRYEDRSNVKTVDQLAPGEMATVIVEVRGTKVVGFRRRNLGLFEARFSDASRAILIGKWFHGAYLEDVIKPGHRIALYGKVEIDSYSRELSMLHPEYEILAEDEEGEAGLHTGRIVPIYEAAGKVTARIFRRLIDRVLQTLAAPPDPLPAAILAGMKLPDLWTAIREMHFPPQNADIRVLNAFRSQAHFRLIFEEFFWLECGLVLRRKSARVLPGIAFKLTDRVREQVKRMLPFKPTAAQKRVLGEIARDMESPAPMNRLLQGDVGSGKTLVAAEAAIIAIENGYQVAVLAPTEILAAQHYLYFKKLFEPLKYQVALLTGSNTKTEKAQYKRALETGLIQVAVGTHALIEQDVAFRSLGLAIVDEQHRFGVMQRLRFIEKGVGGTESSAGFGVLHSDVVVMTATPIPRTLALTLYGDLDVSVIDEMPPGRRPVITKHVPEDRIEQVWSFVQREVSRGRQAYVVYPIIEESETQAIKAAEQMYGHLSTEVFPQLRVGLMHGRLTPAEKESVMDRFKSGEIDVLVSTTVIEVGIDVSNASVMVIEQAERFGLSQLHQLRGRVGRGPERSYCILVTAKLGDTARERIRTMVDSCDGFKIAEMDLRLRGPGEFFGTKQSGLPALRIANIIRDAEILEVARREAAALLDNPEDDVARRAAVAYVKGHWRRRYSLVQVG